MPMPGRKNGYCVSGCRLFAEKHSLNWRAFCHEGIDDEVLLATGDAMALKIVEYAREL